MGISLLESLAGRVGHTRPALPVSPTDLVSDVKRTISVRGIRPADDQRLLFAGRQLEKERALQTYGPLGVCGGSSD
jgi:hypothetical protein